MIPFPLPRFGVHPYLLAAVLALSAGSGAPARAEPASDIAPQSVGGEPVVELAGGAQHSCARVPSGLVWCWGRNNLGQLGDGTTTDRRSPVQVQGLTDAIRIDAGFQSTCALDAGGRVHCWGRNNWGQLGDGTTVNRLVPVQVQGLSRVTDIAKGSGHSCALRDTGRVFCWGNNGRGQLGDGTTTDRTTPVRVSGSWSTNAVQIGAGSGFGCLRRQSGRIACWGANTFGMLGDGSLTDRFVPVPVQGVSGSQHLAVGGLHACALRNNGRVRCWGRNDDGQLGDGSPVNYHRVPVLVSDLTRVTHVAAGFQHSCAIRATGRVFCWGNNFSGQLGDGTTVQRGIPARISGTLMSPAVELSLGQYHSCGFRPNGRAYCWGWNLYGQLGDGTTTDSPVAVRVLD